MVGPCAVLGAMIRVGIDYKHYCAFVFVSTCQQSDCTVHIGSRFVGRQRGSVSCPARNDSTFVHL